MVNGPDPTAPGFVSVNDCVLDVPIATSPKSADPPAAGAITRLPGTSASPSSNTDVGSLPGDDSCKVAAWGTATAGAKRSVTLHSSPSASGALQAVSNVNAATCAGSAPDSASVGGESGWSPTFERVRVRSAV